MHESIWANIMFIPFAVGFLYFLYREYNFLLPTLNSFFVLFMRIQRNKKLFVADRTNHNYVKASNRVKSSAGSDRWCYKFYPSCFIGFKVLHPFYSQETIFYSGVPIYLFHLVVYSVWHIGSTLGVIDSIEIALVS